MDDHSSPMLALLGTVDRALRDQGVDPAIVTTSDKILIATGYVEVALVRERANMMEIPLEVQPRVTLLDTESRAFRHLL